MKTTQRWLYPLIISVLFIPGLVRGQSDTGQDSRIEQRLDRLEHQVQLLVDRQERMAGQAAPRIDQRGSLPDDLRPDLRPFPAPAQRWPRPARRHALCVILTVLMVLHTLLAIWIYTDIRKRGEGHGLFIILALLGGIPASILYALVRIGDRKPAPSPA